MWRVALVAPSTCAYGDAARTTSTCVAKVLRTKQSSLMIALPTQAPVLPPTPHFLCHGGKEAVYRAPQSVWVSFKARMGAE